MNPLSRTRDRLARAAPFLHWRVLAPVLGCTLAPKCLLCVAGGAALFGTRAELCGGVAAPASAFLAPLIGAAVGAGFAAWRHRHRPRASTRRGPLD